MKLFSLLVLTLVVFSTVATVNAEPPDRIRVRDCARELCISLRNCTNGGDGLIGKTQVPKDKAAKHTETAQGRDTTSCFQYAYWAFQSCTNNDLKVAQPTKTTTTKVTDTQAK